MKVHLMSIQIHSSGVFTFWIKNWREIQMVGFSVNEKIKSLEQEERIGMFYIS